MPPAFAELVKRPTGPGRHIGTPVSRSSGAGQQIRARRSAHLRYQPNVFFERRRA
jgi:hypothetical protein